MSVLSLYLNPNKCDLQHSLERFAAEYELAVMTISTSKSEVMVPYQRMMLPPGFGKVAASMQRNILQSYSGVMGKWSERWTGRLVWCQE